jgi:hypothetical protein
MYSSLVSREGPCRYRNMLVHTDLKGITDTPFASLVAHNLISAEAGRNICELTLVYNPFIVQYLPRNDSTGVSTVVLYVYHESN